MKCLEFRRRVRAQTGLDDPAFAEHRRACTACRQAANQGAAWERRLEAATRIEAPAQLASRILLRQALADRGPRRRVWAAAAALVFAAGIGAFAALNAPRWLHAPDASLHQAVIDVIEKETFALAASGPIMPATVEAALSRAGATFDEAIDGIRFAEPCWVRGKIAAHLVVAGESMPVTVFLLPHEHVTRREDFRIGHLGGVLLPSAGGAIAIVGAPGENLAPIEQQVARAIRWNA